VARQLEVTDENSVEVRDIDVGARRTSTFYFVRLEQSYLQVGTSVMHNVIKPENLFLTDWRGIIGDFGGTNNSTNVFEFILRHIDIQRN
jgi:hypothetical protein